MPPASVGRILGREEMTPYDAVLLTLPSDFLGLNTEVAAETSISEDAICKGSSSLDVSSACYKWLKQFIDLKPEVFETSSHGNMRVLHSSTPREGLLLLKFDNVNDAWDFARTAQHDHPPAVSPIFRLGVRLVRSDSFYTNLKCSMQIPIQNTGMPAQGVIASVPFEHPIALREYIMDILRMQDVGAPLNGQALEITGAILRYHPGVAKIMARCCKIPAGCTLGRDYETGKAQAWPQWHIVFEKDGRPMIEIRSGAHAGALCVTRSSAQATIRIDPNLALEWVEKSWPCCPTWTSPDANMEDIKDMKG